MKREVEERHYILQIAFPEINFGPRIPMLLTTVVGNIKDLRPDIVIGSGGGIHAHPQGPVAGARAFRQAIQAAMEGRPLEEAAKEYPELRVALETWVDPFGKGLGV